MNENRLSPKIQQLFQKLEKDPNSKAFVALAELYLQSDMREEALGILSQGIERHPTYVAARMMRGKLYLQRKQIEAAQSDFESVLAAHPEHIPAYKHLAHLYRDVGRLHDAVTLCNQILTLDHKDEATQRLLSSIQEEIVVTDKVAKMTHPLPSPPIASWIASESPVSPSNAESSHASLATPRMLPLFDALPLEQESPNGLSEGTTASSARLQTGLGNI